MRIDKYLVEEGYFESRNRALDAIKAGKVKVDEKIVKPSTQVDNKSDIQIEDSKFYVSRAARKLEAFLSQHPVNLSDKRALDIGSSTGGFAKIVLENSVDSLSCVDVGSEQLHYSLRNDQRVSLYEGQDIRDFHSDAPFDIITCDVSFISIGQIIEDIERLSTPESDIIILYKPQFEVGRGVRRDSRGVVLDQDAIGKKMLEFEVECLSLGWKFCSRAASLIAGKEGNQEYLYHFTKQERSCS